MNKDIICTVCPRGCRITVTGDQKSVAAAEGYGCKRGLEYAKAEYAHPVRILTTTVKTDGGDEKLLPVRSSRPIPKEKIFECMEVIRKTTVKSNVKSHDVVIKNICDTGADIIASKTLN